MRKSMTTLPIEQIKPYENNPRLNDDAVEAVRKSMEQCGYIAPIVVDEYHVVLAGHTRLKALKEMGAKECEVLEVAGLSDDEKRKYRLLDNKTNELALWDFDKLAEELEGLDFDDLELDWGVDLDGDLVFDEPPEEDDFDEDDADEHGVQLGQVWKMGEHRLMCGDSTDKSNVQKLMGGNRADACFTSPPYNMAQEKGFERAPKVAMHNGNAYKTCSDDLNDEEYGDFLCKALGNALSFCDDALFNIGILKGSKYGVVKMMDEYVGNFSDVIVWNKSQSMPSGLPSHGGMLSHRCELIFCFNQQGTRMFTHPQWPIGTAINRIDTNNASQNEYAKEHSATFPVELAFEVARNFSETSVLDLFGGTGTTLIACEQLGRKCYMMELDPHYCDVIISRWENYTGEKAELIAG